CALPIWPDLKKVVVLFRRRRLGGVGLFGQKNKRRDILAFQSLALNIDVELDTGARVEDCRGQLVHSLAEEDSAGNGGRRVNAVVADRELAVDPQFAAVVAGEVEL